MRLSEEQIKQAILHPEPTVGRLALSYFSRSFSQDKTVMPLVIEAIKSLNERGPFQFACEAIELPQTKSTIQWCMEELNQKWGEQNTPTHHILYIRSLSDLLAKADLSLVRDKESEILKLPALHPEAGHALSERISLLSESPESLWNKLMDFCERENEKKYIYEMDTPHAHRIVEALARSGADIADQVLAMLDEEMDFSLGSPRELMQGFVIRLAGELRLTSAVPLLIKAIKDDHEWYSEVSTRALVQIGGRDVLESVSKEFSTAEWSFKLHGIDILEKLHTKKCAEKCVELFNEEEDGEIKTFLGYAALTHFSSEAVEPVRQYILESEFDPEIGELRDTLVTVCTPLEIDFPEFADWKKKSEESRLEYEKKIAEIAEIDTTSLRLLLDEDEEDESVFQSEYDDQVGNEYAEPIYPPRTIFRQKAKIGRNEPCPCNSGKKYKKCCMNKTSEAPMFD